MKHKSNKVKINLKKVLIPIFVLIVIISVILIKRLDLIHKISIAINPINVNKIYLSVEKTEIELDEEANLKVDIRPKNYTKSNLKWHSSNKNVIEVKDGKIIGKSTGKAKIYLTNDDVKSNEIEIECLVKLQEVNLENMISDMQVGSSYQLETKIIPENTTYSNLQFESTSPDIITINETGNLNAVQIGKSTINVKNYKGEVIKTFEIESTKIPVEKITIDDKEVILGKGQTYIINAEVTPENASFKDITWETSDTNIITIENRKIKAVGAGTATITAITDNGDKKETCTFKVNKTNPNNDKKYADGTYNIRTGPGTDYKSLAVTDKYEEIEFLQNTSDGWRKVRNSRGIVGYSYIKNGYYLDELPFLGVHIDNVPYLNQFSLGFPTGCEAVSATMLLKYKGINASAQNVVDNTKCGSKKYQKEDGLWYGADPFEEFVGHPTLRLGDGSYGVFAKPIVDAMNKISGGRAKNISGCSENTLFEYIDKNQPVIVWCVKNAGNVTEGVTWNYENKEGTFQELVGEHCAVLIGYDDNYVYLNDPSAGQNVKQNKSKFINNWKRLHSQAIIVE